MSEGVDVHQRERWRRVSGPRGAGDNPCAREEQLLAAVDLLYQSGHSHACGERFFGDSVSSRLRGPSHARGEET